MQWADRIKRIRITLIVVAVLLSVASLVVSHYLVRDLKREEQGCQERHIFYSRFDRLRSQGS